MDARARDQAAQDRDGSSLDGSIEPPAERRSAPLVSIEDVDGSRDPLVRNNLAPEASSMTHEACTLAPEGFIVSVEGFIVSVEGFIVSVEGWIEPLEGFPVAAKGSIVSADGFIAAPEGLSVSTHVIGGSGATTLSTARVYRRTGPCSSAAFLPARAEGATTASYPVSS
jgi:hypothetical protein